MDGRTYGHLRPTVLGRLFGVDLKMPVMHQAQQQMSQKLVLHDLTSTLKVKDDNKVYHDHDNVYNTNQVRSSEICWNHQSHGCLSLQTTHNCFHKTHKNKA